MDNWKKVTVTDEEALEMMERLADPETYEPRLTARAYSAIDVAIEALKERIEAKNRLKSLD